MEEFERELHQNGLFFEDYYSQRANDLSTESKVDELAAFLETEFTVSVAKQSLRLEHKRLNMLGLVDFIRHNGQINYAKYESSHPSEYKIPVLFNNLAEMALMNHEFNMALNYCQISQNYTMKHHDLYNQLISETLEHIANNLLGKESGTKLEERLQLFINLNYQDTANYYSKLCKQLDIEVG
ncbi:hypothetical protein [Sporolactobacillus nakayamae]|uniref:Uncharacterized protein n=1 Tax=Sporolactobacillus nakayamae TaxID=269670 RepID=A0A1I2QL70_9BACL|nr:hypothetical protein [Sporolactobacillus nakayamae]SFG29182.1 hypothetical protein SAMN02982927_01278 [Sporolactobacillus nakayamae]